MVYRLRRDKYLMLRPDRRSGSTQARVTEPQPASIVPTYTPTALPATVAISHANGLRITTTSGLELFAGHRVNKLIGGVDATHRCLLRLR